MNLDFKLPMTGRAARRLLYLRNLISLEFDEQIANYQHQDVLNTSQIENFLHGYNLPKGLTPKRQSICQFVDDCNYRAVIGAMTLNDVIEMTITSALISQKPLAIIYNQDTIDWEKALADLNISYVTEIPSNDPVTTHVVLVKTKATLDAIKQHGRDRLVVYVPHHYNSSFHQSGEELEFPALRQRVKLLIDAWTLGKEFPHLLAGFYLGHNITSNRIDYWRTDARILDLINAVNLDVKIGKMLSSDANTRKILNSLGFVNANINELAQLINVNVDLLS